MDSLVSSTKLTEYNNQLIKEDNYKVHFDIINHLLCSYNYFQTLVLTIVRNTNSFVCSGKINSFFSNFEMIQNKRKKN